MAQYKSSIALIGPRGAGKSKLARRLHKLCGHPAFSTDTLLSYENGGLPIAEIVKNRGWSGFRDLEYEILKKIAAMPQIIIDCGGGIIIDLKKTEKFFQKPESFIEKYSKAKVRLLRQNCHIVFLKRNKTLLIERNQNSVDRPPLLGDYVELLQKRLTYYKRAADLVIDMDSYSFQDAAELLHKKYFSFAKSAE